METKELENMNTRPRIENSGKVFDRLELEFGGNKYDTQFTSTGNKNKKFIHDMQKIALDVTFTQMTPKKVIKNHGEITVVDIYI